MDNDSIVYNKCGALNDLDDIVKIAQRLALRVEKIRKDGDDRYADLVRGLGERILDAKYELLEAEKFRMKEEGEWF